MLDKAIAERRRVCYPNDIGRHRLAHCLGHIELMSMTRRIISSIAAVTLAIAVASSAYAGVKVTLSYITKWEVIGIRQVVGYVGETPYIFVDFGYYCPALKVGGNFVLRTFSPSIQGGDTVIVNGQSCSVTNVEAIRQD